MPLLHSLTAILIPTHQFVRFLSEEVDYPREMTTGVDSWWSPNEGAMSLSNHYTGISLPGCLCSGCYIFKKKIPQIGWFKQHLFLTPLEAGKSKMKVPVDLITSEGPLLGLEMDAFSLSSDSMERDRGRERERERERRERDGTGGKRKRRVSGESFFMSLLIRALILSSGLYPHDFITSQRPISKFHHIWDKGLNIRILRGHNHAVHNI